MSSLMSTICANVRRNLFKLVRLHFHFELMPILFAMDGQRRKGMKEAEKNNEGINDGDSSNNNNNITVRLESTSL